MDKIFKIQPALAVSDAESVPKQDWHAPVITRIDIKRTMFNTGSHGDGPGHSSGTV